MLPAALAGRLSGVSRLSPVHPVDEPVAAALIDECVAVVGGEVALHSCADGLPWSMLQRSAVSAVSFDLSTLTAGEPSVSAIHPGKGFTASEVLLLAAVEELRYEEIATVRVIRADRTRAANFDAGSELVLIE